MRALFLLLLLPAVAHAAWTTNGNPVVNATNTQNFTGMCPDGSGGALFAWADERTAPGTVNAYVQRLKGDGTVVPGWPVNGVAVSSSGTVDRVYVNPDGLGGALVLWRQTNPSGFYLMRVDGGGAIHPGWPAGGRRLNDDFTTGAYSTAKGPGGSFWFGWTQYRPLNDAYIAKITRIDSSGTTIAPFDTVGYGLAIEELITSLALVTDTTGAVIYTVGKYFNAPVDQIHTLVGRVNTAGVRTLEASLPYGEQVTAAAIAVPDGAGGLFAAWATHNTFPVSNGLWAQHYGPGSTKLWPDSVTVPFVPVLVAGTDGGVYHLGATGANQLNILHRTSDGSIAPGWTPGGLTLTTGARLAQIGGVATEPGLIVSWAETGAGTDLRARGVLATGAPDAAWPAAGAIVCNATGNQGGYSFIPTATGGAIFGWSDDRGPNRAVYATRVEVSPPLSIPPAVPGVLAFRAVAPNPARDVVRVELASVANRPVTIELVDVRGRVLSRREAAATTTLSTRGLPPGLYWLRATQDNATATARIAVVR